MTTWPGTAWRASIAVGVIALVLCALTDGTLGATDSERADAISAAVAKIRPSLVRIETIGGIDANRRTTSDESTSTGVIVSSDGHVIVSSFALRHNPRSNLVRLDDGSRHAATVVARDHTRGLSLLKIDSETTLARPTIVNTDELQVGQTAVALGRAVDEQVPNVSVGIISALSRAGGRAIQTDANTSRNHYGGALIDIEGRLIGVVVPVAPLAGGIVANLDLYDSGISFAIPAEQVTAAVERLKAGTDLLPGKLGVSLEAATTIDAPAVVALCRPNSDAYSQGVRPGDQIVAIAGKPVDRQAQLGQRLATRYAGESVAVTLSRNDETIELNVELRAKFATYQPPLLGVLPARERGHESSDPAGSQNSTGVVVREVLADSPASEADLRPGDRITALDASETVDAAQLRALLEDRRVGDTAKLSILRDEELVDVEITLTDVTDDFSDEAPDDAVHDLSGDARSELGSLDIPGFDTPAQVFAPGDDDEHGRCGLVVWINDKPDTDVAESLRGWSNICDGQRWTMVAITMPTERSATESIERICAAIEFCREHFETDSDRTVLLAHGDAALLAWQTAQRRGDLCRGVLVVEPTQIGPIRELMPGQTFELLLTTVADDATAKRAEAVIAKLRQWKYRVTVATTDERLVTPPVTPSEEMIRWLDRVDRL